MATHYYYETIENLKIVSLDVKDIRFPTSLGLHGSDAMHRDPDFSCAYVTLRLASGTSGNGFTFTCGRGNEIVVAAIKSLSFLVVGATVVDIYKDFAAFSRSLTNETQLRWLGPEKGVTHLATAAILNALWDLWAKLLKKPVWRLLTDLTPEQLVSTIDFKYIKDVITKEEAIEILRKGHEKKEERIKKITADGYPAYTSQNGWIGYSKETLIELTEKYNDLGFNHFKIKVGINLDDDIRRLKIVRNIIGWDKKLSIDANQVWDVEEAIPWIKKLAGFKLTWVEEPTSPDDIIGHATISKQLNPLGIGVASGEMCSNKVLFKEFLLTDAVQYVQADPTRLAGINEMLAVYLMAHKKGVKVVPHGGALGLGEMIQHLQFWDYVSLSGTTEDRYIEFIDLQHEHFVNPVSVKNGRYEVPTTPGYSTTLKEDSIIKYEYPMGTEWENMFSKGLFHDPRKAPSRRTSSITSIKM